MGGEDSTWALARMMLRRWKTAEPEGDGEQLQIKHTWYVRGSFGAVQLVLKAHPAGSWEAERARLAPEGIYAVEPAGIAYWPVAVGFHSPERRRGEDSGELHTPECPTLDGGECFYDSDGLLAVELMHRWAKASFNDEVIYDGLTVAYAMDLSYDEPADD